MIFSYEERKVGSYFGTDLYEKCIAVDETAEASSLDISVDIENAITMIDAIFYAEANTDGEKFVSNGLVSPTVSTSIVQGYNLTMYDYESNELPASVKITGYESGFACKGILKVQYLK